MKTAISTAPPMPRKIFRKHLPSHESVRNNRHIARFGGLLQHHNLWHLNRHSVAGGVAVGMFSGLVPGPLQMLTAALLAVPLRVNLPVALAPPPDVDWSHLEASLDAFLHWALSMGTPLAVGLPALALALAALGYACVQVGWRTYVIRAWRKRGQARSRHGR